MHRNRSLYRELLRLARCVDREAVSALALVGRPPRRYDVRTWNPVLTKYNGSCFAEDVVAAAGGGATEFPHPTPRGAPRAVRAHCERARALGLPYGDDAVELVARFKAARAIVQEVRPLAEAAKAAEDVYAALRPADKAKSKVKARAETGGGSPVAGSSATSTSASVASATPPLQESFGGSSSSSSSSSSEGSPSSHTSSSSTAGGAAAAATPAAVPSSPTLRRLLPYTPCDPRPVVVGDCLMMHPVSAFAGESFDKAIVLIDVVNEDEITGIVVNNAFSTTVGKLLERLKGGDNDLSHLDLRALGDCRLYRGGPIVMADIMDCFCWLHVFGKDVEGAREVAPGIYLGGNLEVIAKRAAESELDLSQSIRFFLGYAGWAPNQLKMELECGIWLRAHPQEEESKGVGLETTDTVQTVHDFCFGDDHKKSWQAALRSAGREDFACFPRGPHIDPRLRRYIERVQKGLDVETDFGPANSPEAVVKGGTVSTSSSTSTSPGEAADPEAGGEKKKQLSKQQILVEGILLVTIAVQTGHGRATAPQWEEALRRHFLW
eukprot:CAMPEP_0206453466 /NCGR_PEP_ID=MMETSP0324_2-20121206/20562_1 /ASSEMBLY_ACC=CAM_ASM_000836 /TAXON_ID=2866 /ORGANISM="Crypthecodinium cohnii, Strain Seligo" /LENGTH=550 /DNA_ID=CAMNT_0053923761 /DNA_START=36 /DNA_END=1684 /DNA_ORIENTATION=-